MVDHTVAEYTVAIVDHNASNYTTVKVDKTMIAVAENVVDATVEASTSINVLLPSYSMYPLSFPGVGHILDNPSLHVR